MAGLLMKAQQARRIFEALNGAGCRYLVVGGIAVIAHGFVRLTTDIDIVLQLTPENVQAAMGALANLRYQPLVPVDPREFGDPAARERWAVEKSMIVFQMLDFDDTRTRLDIFIREPFDFDFEYERALWDDFDGVRVPIVALEQLRKLKLAAGRPQDLIDLQTLDETKDE